MKDIQNVKVNGGISFFGLLTLIFITLKLTGHITWSWWAVLAPIWIPVIIIVILGLFIIVVSESNKK